ncbi:FMN-linked oxidoreductase [Polyplosphaeria fusca]|uniref:Dihydroorotate dehydrogenase (quinone), mitochondrial n=1 Tax=Polyplosphaeria fusca TaxID=682080 RepID=A0A9P4QT73_9PLEO|nr:FMN-linked oxidoreductase [Polyplosphaeria fusca]
MPAGSEYAAEQLKNQGNKHFKDGEYDDAEALYSQAIQKNSKNPLLFTNRANARLKQEKWEGVIDDCLRSIELLKENMKAFFYLAQAQIAVNHPNEALTSALTAYELCVTTPAQTNNAAHISALVVRCKKAKWDMRERDRVRRRADLLSKLQAKLDVDYKAAVADVDEAVEKGEKGQVEASEEKQELRQGWEREIADLRTAFAISDPEHLEKREVPDYLVDGITFEIMHDPVVTRNGRSYERATLIEHLKRSPIDPLTREPLRIEDLRPNMALKEACTEFMEHNSGWVYDCAAQMRAIALRHSLARPRPSLRRARLSPRHASTASDARSAATRTKNLVYGTLLALGSAFGFLYITDTRSSVHEWLVVPALRVVYPDGEDAHRAGTTVLKALYSFGLHPRERGDVDAAGDLHVDVFGQTIVNPIGTSAGIDKGAEVPTPLLALGPAIVEVGAVTPHPQEGNPKPRVFRIPSQKALINRYGFNSEGVETVAMRLRQRLREFAYHAGLGIDDEAERKILDGEAGVPPGSLTPGRLLAVQVAKNKTTPETDMEAVKRDYVTGVAHLAKYADIIVVNVSSPNTPGLRSLQNVEPLTNLLTSVVHAVDKIDRKTKPAVMVKISGICEAIWNSGVHGVIVGNTTKKRPDPIPKGYMIAQSEARLLLEQGGYSGPQMFERTRDLVKRYRIMLDHGPKQLTPPSSPDSNPAPAIAPAPAPAHAHSAPLSRKAREILDAGASVAMVYTALVYGGVGTITRIKREMREEATKDQ